MPYGAAELTLELLRDAAWGTGPARRTSRYLTQLLSEIEGAFPDKLIGRTEQIGGGMTYCLKPGVRIAVVQPEVASPTEAGLGR
jgi:hypothetical protein